MMCWIKGRAFHTKHFTVIMYLCTMRSNICVTSVSICIVHALFSVEYRAALMNQLC